MNVKSARVFRRVVAGGAGLLLMAPLAAFAALEAAWSMTWQSVGAPSKSGTLPLVVSLNNKGKDNAGEAVVLSQHGSVRVPFEIPADTKKNLTIFVPWGDTYEEPTLQINHRFGSQSTTIPLGGRRSDTRLEIAVLGDRIADFVFMGLGTFDGQPVGVFPAEVGQAPERTSAYLPFDAVILSEGAERLSDAAVKAVKNYVLSGGRLYVFGGSNSLVVNDPRWSDLMPISDARPQQAPPGFSFDNTVVPSAKERRLAYKSEGPMSWLTGTRKQGVKELRSGERTMAYLGYHGQGMVIVAAWNPSEQPMRAWEGRDDFTRGFVAKFVSSEGASLMHLARTTTAGDKYLFQQKFASLTSGTASQTGGAAAALPRPEDPFKIRPPSAGMVVAILCAYWFCLIPLHFGVLKKFDRRNWAWVTAPLIAIGFAGIFFSFASSLYASVQSRSQQGVLAARAGDSEGYAVVWQDLFFPNAGREDLKLRGVETAWEPSTLYPAASSGIGATRARLTDNGTVTAQDLEVKTISFRNFAFTQPLALGEGIAAKVTRKGEGANASYIVEIRNGTPYRLGLQQIKGPRNLGWTGPTIGPFEPGEAKTARFELKQEFARAWGVLPLSMQGSVEGLPVGSTSGELQPGNDSMILMVHLANLELSP